MLLEALAHDARVNLLERAEGMARAQQSGDGGGTAAEKAHRAGRRSVFSRALWFDI